MPVDGTWRMRDYRILGWTSVSDLATCDADRRLDLRVESVNLGYHTSLIAGHIIDHNAAYPHLYSLYRTVAHAQVAILLSGSSQSRPCPSDPRDFHRPNGDRSARTTRLRNLELAAFAIDLDAVLRILPLLRLLPLPRLYDVLSLSRDAPGTRYAGR